MINFCGIHIFRTISSFFKDEILRYMPLKVLLIRFYGHLCSTYSSKIWLEKRKFSMKPFFITYKFSDGVVQVLCIVLSFMLHFRLLKIAWQKSRLVGNIKEHRSSVTGSSPRRLIHDCSRNWRVIPNLWSKILKFGLKTSTVETK